MAAFPVVTTVPLPSRARTGFARSALHGLFALTVLPLALAGCGRESSTPPAQPHGQVMEEATVRAGDVTVRASVVPTLRVGEAVARQYGIERGPGRVLVLVGVRQGPETGEIALPAQVTLETADLRGVSERQVLREVRSGGPPEQALIDYVGTVRVTPPETLRFDIRVERAGEAPIRLQFSRDVFPD
ncbi:DUF4426 domain-containing protein [Marilutibacter chinensis]|uniref:DUF4426 domain-containing protein n=1 Tax=Marilutibacter chinensis TaxID=2912247 RepID=A0ABS9HWD9_9GAMM|nr:DUF4426 domain-containing protein [Lysobacter chinensis]MCF7222499.1 DUF4426 domain-containing protein [Lysobacter chinensis]